MLMEEGSPILLRAHRRCDDSRSKGRPVAGGPHSSYRQPAKGASRTPVSPHMRDFRIRNLNSRWREGA